MFLKNKSHLQFFFSAQVELEILPKVCHLNNLDAAIVECPALNWKLGCSIHDY